VEASPDAIPEIVGSGESGEAVLTAPLGEFGLLDLLTQSVKFLAQHL